MDNKNRRQADRHEMWFPMQIAGSGDVILGVSRDVSARGVLLVTAAAPELDAAVEVTVRFKNGTEQVLKGTIRRIEKNDDDADGLWPHQVAVHLEEEAPELPRSYLPPSYSESPPQKMEEPETED